MQWLSYPSLLRIDVLHCEDACTMAMIARSKMFCILSFR